MSLTRLNLENLIIPLEEIMLATRNLSQENWITGGEFSMLYHGQFPKRWENRKFIFKLFTEERCHGKEEFLNELNIISSLNHKNIIHFVGYCDEGNVMFIVYDYPVNSSLDHHLRIPHIRNCLTWEHRLKICLDVAIGLNYLHSGLGEHGRVIHGSLMPTNIMLDDNMTAKLIGFELSVLIPGNQPRQQVYKPSRPIELTLNPLDPVYSITGILNAKLDVYWFGVILFQILIATYDVDEDEYLGTWDGGVRPLVKLVERYKNIGLDKFIDPVIRHEAGGRSFHIIKEIAYKCISYNIKGRPTMDRIVKMIQEALDIHNQEAASTSIFKRKGARGFLISVEEMRLAIENFDLYKFVDGDYYRYKYYIGELSNRCQNRKAVMKIFMTYEWFSQELYIVSRFHHENIMPYIGHCDQNEYGVLVFEHAINGSLLDHLRDPNKMRYLTWEQRLKICIGAARGLRCLHSGLRDENRIVLHRRVSSGIIFLDENMEAKISGFDSSMLVPKNQVQYVSDRTMVYALPHEYIDPIQMETLVINVEADVYAFGVNHQTATSTATMGSHGYQKLEDLLIPLKEINLATCDFDNSSRIGDGGFGVVYKGRLSESWKNQEVAIKRLNKSGYQGKKEFLNELKLISRFHHQNIIPFIGYCDEGDEMILIYEYAINGSLDHHLQDRNKRRHLTWAQRLKICLGAAKGLDYLHSGLGDDNKVIHRDIKSGNILLGENLEAKICDFGLSKSDGGNQQQTKLYTNAAGTNYYMDPIYHESGILRTESDVYSFGVVMFEMLSGMPAWHRRRLGQDKPQPLIYLVRRYYDFGKDLLIDPQIKDQIDNDSFHTFIEIAYQCISFNSKERPTMEMIADKIEEALDFQQLYIIVYLGTKYPAKFHFLMAGREGGLKVSDYRSCCTDFVFHPCDLSEKTTATDKHILCFCDLSKFAPWTIGKASRTRSYRMCISAFLLFFILDASRGSSARTP
ncbi:hypothetical protein CTI12_AA069310 [Artemisia annua]|uniref:Protein kinase domain-containing protein n=1 Tax=Artemisia annua TaxID=35608 RepID=A0A2U1Q6P6_ARTAN|nr:hypothetical protein CTI12_AA069310 [Artemisia annua]